MKSSGSPAEVHVAVDIDVLPFPVDAEGACGLEFQRLATGATAAHASERPLLCYLGRFTSATLTVHDLVSCSLKFYQFVSVSDGSWICMERHVALLACILRLTSAALQPQVLLLSPSFPLAACKDPNCHDVQDL